MQTNPRSDRRLRNRRDQRSALPSFDGPSSSAFSSPSVSESSQDSSVAGNLSRGEPDAALNDFEENPSLTTRRMDATLDALLSTHRSWLRTALYARLQCADAVDDVMQELAVVVLRGSAPVRDEARIGPWLYRVAVRQALLYRRTRGRVRKTENGARERLEGRDAEATLHGDPSSLAISEERDDRIRREVAGLPRRDREILMLKYSDDLNYRQIGERLGLSVSAVEARLHRARVRLRSRLRDFVETP